MRASPLTFNCWSTGIMTPVLWLSLWLMKMDFIRNRRMEGRSISGFLSPGLCLMNGKCVLHFPELSLATASKCMSNPECYFPCLCSIYCRANAAGKTLDEDHGDAPWGSGPIIQVSVPSLGTTPQDLSQHSVNQFLLSSGATTGPAFVQVSLENPQTFFWSKL